MDRSQRKNYPQSVGDNAAGDKCAVGPRERGGR